MPKSRPRFNGDQPAHDNLEWISVRRWDASETPEFLKKLAKLRRAIEKRRLELTMMGRPPFSVEIKTQGEKFDEP